MRSAPTRLIRALSLTAGLTAATACATNPATGKKEVSLMSEQQEIATGQQMDGEVIKQMGLYDDPELQRYVSDVGMRLAKVSPRPNLPWKFTVVNQPAVNAFALPGGFIYITRGILPFLNDEAELAGVLGHEIGHVTARHSAQQYTKATSASIGMTLLSIFVPQTRPLQGLTETALGVLFLKYGRDDENQADELGAQYAAKGGWDPHGVAGMLTTLDRLDASQGSSKGVPNWLSTHPAPANRVEHVQQVIAKIPDAHPGAGTGERERATFLQKIDGILFGDNPEEGVVRGNQFLHKDLKFALTFPQGWDVQNAPQQVASKAPGVDAFVLLEIVQQASGSIEQVAVGSMEKAGFRPVNGSRTELHGLNAFVGTYQGNLQGLGSSVIRAAHIAHEGRVFMVAGIAAQQMFERVQEQLDASIASFRPLSAQEAANIQPNRVDLYTVRQGDTWESIASRAGAGTIKPSTLAIMNHHDPNEPPPVGARIKIVVTG
jgi:predicted Zn-dependent protease